MNFSLGERHRALGFVREALTLSPKMSTGLAMLAALEASNMRPGQEDKLHAILKRLDSILAADRTCRRGRYYRGQILRQIGDLGGAIEEFRAAVASDPEDVDAQRELRQCQREPPKSSGSLLDRLRGR